MARRVRRLPAAPTMEMTMQLELNYNAIMVARYGVNFISHRAGGRADRTAVWIIIAGHDEV